MDYLTTALIIVLTTFLTRWLLLSRKKTAVLDSDGSLILKYPGYFMGVGVGVIVFGAVIALITFTQVIKTSGNEVVPFLVGFFVFMGIPLIMLAVRVRVIVTDQKIQYHGLITKPKEIYWSEIQRVTFSFTSELVFHSFDKKIKLNTALMGMDSFVQKMTEKISPTLYQTALQEYNKIMGRMNGK